ncbi:zinc finger MYM-type protein 1-like [Myzus persicae]|uniref:zinc finger MYM-type protein 1-like n=1 Tax=Myzus persicae TaxID=13164 RepID=UPI000B9326F9|nr:zinc finger MYM-type protein 1-like [Myzus persicae]
MSTNICLCGKNKLRLNDTNWKRHLTACNVAKLKKSNLVNDVSSFFSKKRVNNVEHTQRQKINLVPHCSNSETAIIDSDSNSFQRFPNDPALILSTSSNAIMRESEVFSIIESSTGANTNTDCNIELDDNSTAAQYDKVINTETAIIDSDSNSFQRFPNDPEFILPTSSNAIMRGSEVFSFIESSTGADTNTDCNIELDNNSTAAQYDQVINTETAIIIDSDSNSFQRFPNDPALILSTNSNEYFAYLASLHPCQPLPAELKNQEFPKRKQVRNWVSYSPSEDKVYCIVCKLFGTTHSKCNQLAKCGSNDWRHIAYKLKVHECSTDHLQSEIRRAMYISNQRVNITTLGLPNSIVAENREIVKIIFDVLIYLARQNSAFRGHNESWSSKNQGNFLELLKLMSKHNALLKSHLSKITNASKKNRITFLSSDSQNTMLNVLGEIVRLEILKKVKKARVFSIIIDTTTDVANLEQFSLVLRFVNDDHQPEERLIAVKVASDASGKGLFDLFCEICNLYELDWENNLCAQSYDGAACMQGQYSGVRSYIQDKNPQAIYIWCFSHILNLVIVDTCDKSTSMRNFFGELQSVISFMRARKRTAIFKEQQIKVYPDQRVSRIKNFSTTRWTSHDRAISIIHDKYEALLMTLEELTNSPDRDCSSTAKNLHIIISSFTFVLNLKLMKKIFCYTTPLSVYLQSPAIDFIQALTMVDNVSKQIKKLRTNHEAENLLNEAKTFASDNGLTESCLPEVHVRRRKIMAGEASTEHLIVNPLDKFRTEVYFVILDQITNSILMRFDGARNILKDFSILSYDRLMATSNGEPIPNDLFETLVQWIPNLQLEELKNEYLIFASSFKSLQSSLNLTSLSNSENEISITEENTDACDSDTFPNLFVAYKYLCTIPATSVSSERSFSKLKLIKTRLRSTMQQNRLESLLLLSYKTSETRTTTLSSQNSIYKHNSHNLSSGIYFLYF